MRRIPRALAAVLARLRGLARRDGLADEIREELRLHFESRVQEYQADGLSPADARRKAAARVGDVETYVDRGYGIRGHRFIETVSRDVRYGLRILRRQPGFAALAIATLAVGVGASTAVFSIIDATMLRPLPYSEPEQLFRVGLDGPPQLDGRPNRPLPSAEDAARWRRAEGIFSDVALWSSRSPVVTGPEPIRVDAMEVTEQYLPLYRVRPALGRGFNADDIDAGAPDVVILNHDFWMRRYGGDPAVIGTTLVHDDTAATIVGVLPAGFHSGEDLFLPLRQTPERAARRGIPVVVLARLRNGVSPADAAIRLSAITPPEEDGDGQAQPVRVRLDSELDAAIERVSTTVLLLTGAVALVLLIGCVNVAGLLLARGAARRSEVAVRASLGASRMRLVRQFVTEGLVLAAAATLGGVLLAWLTLGVLVTNLPMPMPSGVPVAIDVRVLLAAIAVGVSTGLGCALVPAMRSSRPSLTATLGATGRGASRSLTKRSGQALIAVEVALALVLLAGAGLLLRSFARITSVDLGFDPSHVLVMEAQPVDPADQPSFYPAVLDQVRQIPGVTSAGALRYFPLRGAVAFARTEIDGRPAGASAYPVLPGALETLGIPLRAGRLPVAGDEGALPRPVVINEQAARTLFSGESPLGRRLTIEGLPSAVIGVVGDIRRMGPTGDVWDEVYPLLRPEDVRRDGLVVVARVEGPMRDTADRMREAARSVDSGVLVDAIRTGDDWFGSTVRRPRQRTVLLTALGGLGLLLALVGIFGTTAYAVARRTREFGIRMAFGARADQIVRVATLEVAGPVLVGVIAGLVGARFATALLAAFLFDTEPTDLTTFAAATALLVVAALLAAWIPARRAAHVDPVSALRVE